MTCTITNTFDARPTTWRASLGAAGDTWRHAASGLVVRLAGVGAGRATVTVCRKGGAETAATCAAGVDFDCNGLAGAKDPACAKFATKAAVQVSPSPRPPPPPLVRRSARP